MVFITVVLLLEKKNKNISIISSDWSTKKSPIVL